ncbi:PTS system cellobiose-specific IIB component [Breznakia sp. PF5-3]|uniref:PTS sugar transporter subunit IIB n=1 Tax=unclassified Breznakia TaxID=2623764 RepID=UPI0024070AB6|nr:MULTISPECIES: PTS sugar transporter subunit IIB [unclassified Breznakia]MDF9824533.1 PTS system cellobiose-specific IIB component [Breznakia sp. PM6-1]MDF9835319.1 PTS system cellobiose-specific IIB component [Breznakia sp. PF5-3]MDF9837035.1 PTS system cellobiose-specific IIB component [Breznakia sp. PFB2-8]MDF9858960.1 PTS system cellobiose-specific IIB component [Breznakia sp. PH5-24]
MAEKFILLACGSGASSGFMANSIRKAAKAKGLDYAVEAVSEAELEDYWDKVDCVLLGPHLAYIQKEYEKQGKPFNVPVACISQIAYGSLNGEMALQNALDLMAKGVHDD